MPVTNPDIASLDAFLSRWEAAEYAAEAFVIIGCVGEFIAEFSQIRTQEWRHQLGKISLLVLISALALELGALVRTNALSGQEIARLNGTAADAIARAASAEEKAKGFDSRIADAQRGTAEAQRDAESAKERASKADERASANEREAARLSKLAADEQLARATLESEIQARTMTLKQQQDIVHLGNAVERSFRASLSECTWVAVPTALGRTRWWWRDARRQSAPKARQVKRGSMPPL